MVEFTENLSINLKKYMISVLQKNNKRILLHLDLQKVIETQRKEW